MWWKYTLSHVRTTVRFYETQQVFTESYIYIYRNVYLYTYVSMMCTQSVWMLCCIRATICTVIRAIKYAFTVRNIIPYQQRHHRHLCHCWIEIDERSPSAAPHRALDNRLSVVVLLHNMYIVCMILPLCELTLAPAAYILIHSYRTWRTHACATKSIKLISASKRNNS